MNEVFKVQFGFSCCLILLLQEIFLVDAKILRWLPSNKLENPINFLEDKPSEECNGIIFPKDLGQEVIVNKTQAKEYVLPENGMLVFRDGGAMEVNDDVDKCVRIKHMKKRSWADPNNWDYGTNKAVPHDERLPCHHDEVIFPEEFQFSLPYNYVPYNAIALKSITVENKKLTLQEWRNILAEMLTTSDDVLVQSPNYITIFDVGEHWCKSGKGCLCHPEMPFGVLRVDCATVVCPQPHCYEPIPVVGHCCPVCGGRLMLTPKENFDIKAFEKRIPKIEDLDFYYSSVFINQNEMQSIQVVFVKREEYDGTSAEVTRNFYDDILADMESYKVLNVYHWIAGQPHIPGDHTVPPSIWIIFGTFLACVMTFVLIYLLYGPLDHVKMPFGSIPFDFPGNRLTRYANPFTFARFENIREGEGGLILGDQSVIGSVISLDKAFDNPLYDEPSTSGSEIPASLVVEETVSTETPQYEKVAEKEVAMLETTNIYTEVADLATKDEENEL